MAMSMRAQAMLMESGSLASGKTLSLINLTKKLLMNSADLDLQTTLMAGITHDDVD